MGVFFSDQLDGDFMLSSPVRNLPSPQTSTYNYNYNYAQAMQGQSLSGCSPPRLLSQIGPFSSTNKGKGLSPLQSLSRCSPPRLLSQIGPFSSTNKGKGLSPLHRVFNSSKNQYMQPAEGLSLLAIEEFLDDYNGSSSHSFDVPDIVPAVDGLTISNNSSSFCSSVSEPSSLGSSQLTQESDIYQISDSVASGQLSVLLQQDRHQDNQLQQKQTQQQEQYHHNLNHSLMAPQPIGSGQEQDSGLQLVHLLLACAEAVAKEDNMLARRYILHLNRVVSALGDSMQRVAA
nr:hypothetical protein CFP56_39383 [Quercus suber]